MQQLALDELVERHLEARQRVHHPVDVGRRRRRERQLGQHALQQRARRHALLARRHQLADVGARDLLAVVVWRLQQQRTVILVRSFSTVRKGFKRPRVAVPRQRILTSGDNTLSV